MPLLIKLTKTCERADMAAKHLRQWLAGHKRQLDNQPCPHAVGPASTPRQAPVPSATALVWGAWLAGERKQASRTIRPCDRSAGRCGTGCPKPDPFSPFSRKSLSIVGIGAQRCQRLVEFMTERCRHLTEHRQFSSLHQLGLGLAQLLLRLPALIDLTRLRQVGFAEFREWRSRTRAFEPERRRPGPGAAAMPPASRRCIRNAKPAPISKQNRVAIRAPVHCAVSSGRSSDRTCKRQPSNGRSRVKSPCGTLAVPNNRRSGEFPVDITADADCMRQPG